MPFHSMLLSVRSPFTVSDNKMTITNLFKPNQKRPHKSKLQEFQQNLHKIDTSQQKRKVIYHLWRCVIIKGLIKCKKVSNVNRFSIAISTALVSACSVPRSLPVLAPHVDEVRDVVAAVQQGTVHEVLRVLDEHLQSGRGQGYMGRRRSRGCWSPP